MSKWKNVRTYMEVNPYTGQPKDEDIANVTGPNVAGTGDDSSVVVVRKKKKTLIDARSKSYKQHRKKLEQARQRREERKSRLAQKVEQNIGIFTREGYLEEEKPSSYILSTLRDIVKNKSAKKGDKVIAFDDEPPIDTVLGVEIFPVIHAQTQEKIYVSLEDIKDV